MSNLVGNLWILFKLRIGFAIMLCALAGVFTPGPAWLAVILWDPHRGGLDGRLLG